ncbi:hypothetical protein [Moorena sp. SIO3I6]|uniref:hypothetical protein n=1 Tax=Moorena sp. SIO3I6 TaxID=2607831 RepID=UPI0013F8BAD5|nr:hypothetical protein [Moorena sp. SIO3I6]NEP26136.1 hypothetical protein [Moorena sp. SIO3I6]
MPSKKPETNPYLELITKTGIKVIQKISLLIIIGISLFAMDEYYLQKGIKCDEKETINWQCNASPLLGNLGTSLFQVALTFWVVDIGLKRETLEEMEKVFRATQATKHIRGFYSQREEYNHLIEKNFKESRKQEIKLLCLSEDLNIFNQQNMNIIRDKIKEGCELKILLLHPESSLIECLNHTGLTPNLEMMRSLFFKLGELKKQLIKYIKNNHKIQGAIEVRLHKNAFSPIGYYSDCQDFTIVWMYFSDQNDGHEYPAFHINNMNLIESAENHFNNLWTKTRGEDNILLRLTPDSKNVIDKTQDYLSTNGVKPI